jgi:uncharacterized membrane protein (DUF485 family)
MSSYVGALISVLSALTLTDIGVLIGICSAVVTFILNYRYQKTRMEMDRETHRLNTELLMKQIEKHMSEK